MDRGSAEVRTVLIYAVKSVFTNMLCSFVETALFTCVWCQTCPRGSVMSSRVNSGPNFTQSIYCNKVSVSITGLKAVTVAANSSARVAVLLVY